MPVFINADYEGWFAVFAARNNGLGLNREGKRLLLREANRAVVDVWHRRVIRKHFEPQARSRYHYQQRKGPYRGIKQDLARGTRVFVNGKEIEPENIIKGGQVDIVRSGSTEAKANIQTAIQSSAKQAVTRVIVPSYVKKRRAGQPDQGKEIQRVTKSEVHRFTMVWRGEFFRGVRKFSRHFRLKRRLGKRSGKV